MRLPTLALALVFGAIALVAGAETTPQDAGAALYSRLECAGCHEYAEIPGFEVVALDGLGKRYDAPALSALLANPPPGMPAFELDAAQREALARHLRQRFP